MTLDEMKRSDKAMLSTKDVSEVLGIHPYTISLRAKADNLPFPFFRSGNRTKIPRVAFLKWGGWLEDDSGGYNEGNGENS